MPLRHRPLASWYIQLAQQLEAGMPLAGALRAARSNPRIGRLAETMAAQIDRGGNVDEALRAAGTALPMADQLVLSAAAESGRMPQSLRHLAGRHEKLGAAKLRIVLASAYPLVVVHFALLLLPLTRMIDWQTGFHWSTIAYVRMLAETLVPLWVVVLTLVVLARRGSPALIGVARRLPALRGYLRAQALADLTFALANFLEAGVPIGDAWAAAGLVARSPDLQSASDGIAEAISHGQAPGPRLATWPCFPPEFVAEYRSGETTGQLDVGLFRLSTQYQETANRSLTIATMLYPALLFIVVAAGVVFFVASFYAGYLKMVTNLAN